jgi:hypothetical protein
MTSPMKRWLSLLAFSLVAACGDADTSRDVGAAPVVLTSPNAGVAVRVSVAGGRVERGRNDFDVVLQAGWTLVSARALMPAHGHGAEGPIEREGAAFRIARVPLYMAGRWSITLELRSGADTDTVEFGVDVP